MNANLMVADAWSLPGISCLIEFDPDLPLRFRTNEQPIGAGYVRLGDYTNTLAELIVEPSTGVVRGITITAFRELAPWPQFTLDSSQVGLPILAEPPKGGQHIDLDRDFSVAIRDQEALLFWGRLGPCQAIMFADRVCFMTQQGELQGVLFLGLSRSDGALLAAHGTRAPFTTDA